MMPLFLSFMVLYAFRAKAREEHFRNFKAPQGDVIQMQADLLKEANRKLDLKLKQEGMASSSSSKQLDEAKEIERALKQKDMEDRLVKEQLAMNRCAH